MRATGRLLASGADSHGVVVLNYETLPDGRDLDENNMPRLRFNKIDADNMIAVYDYNISPEMVFAARWYDVTINKKKSISGAVWIAEFERNVPEA